MICKAYLNQSIREAKMLIKALTLLSVIGSTSIMASEFSGFLQDKVTSLEVASAVCTEQNMTLPTAREFAELAMQKGAVGITEVPTTDSYLVEVYTPGSPMDKFYYSSEGYKATRMDADVSCVWTSSLNPKHPLTYHEYLVTFKPLTGAIHTQVSDYRNTIVSCAVMCKK